MNGKNNSAVFFVYMHTNMVIMMSMTMIMTARMSMMNENDDTDEGTQKIDFRKLNLAGEDG